MRRYNRPAIGLRGLGDGEVDGTSSFDTFDNSNGDPLSVWDDPLTGTPIDTTVPISTPAPPVAGASTSGLTAAQIATLSAAGIQAAIQVIKSTGTPSLIPGTALVYNPATNQILPATGSSLLTGGLTATTTSMLPILLIGGLAVVLLMGSKR